MHQRLDNLVKLLIVDDDPRLCSLYKEKLEALSIKVTSADSIDEMYGLLQRTPFDLVLLDVYLGQIISLDYLKDLFLRFPKLRLVMLTSSENEKIAAQSLSNGAIAFLTKENQLNYNITMIQRLIADQSKPISATHAKNLENDIPLLGSSRFAQDLRQKVSALVNLDKPVCIHGPYGAGKRALAQAIHERSPRACHPFLTINCINRREDILEIELFGSDSKQDSPSKLGRLAIAGKGAVLLEGINKLSPRLQVRLVKYLEKILHKDVNPIDSPRIFTTSKVNLRTEVKIGSFSKELYELIATTNLELYPLTGRLDDIQTILKALLANANDRFNKKVSTPSKHVFHLLRKHTWPGNLLELRHVVFKAVMVADENASLKAENLLPLEIARLKSQRQGKKQTDPFRDLPMNYNEARKLFETAYVTRLLERSGGNISEASKLAGTSRSMLYRIMKKHDSGQSQILGGNF